MAKLNKAVKYLCYVLELLLFYILQCSPYLFPTIFKVTPMLIMASAVTIALLESDISSIFIGVIAGFLIDLSFGSFFGLFACIMAVICCLISVITNNKSKVNIHTASLTGTIALLICIACDWYFRYVSQGYSARWIVLFDNYLPIYIYSLLCLPLVYLLNFAIYNGFKYVKE